MSSELQALLKRIQPPKPKYAKPRAPSSDLLALVDRMEIRDWLYEVELGLVGAVVRLRNEVKFIGEHLPHCDRCKAELQLDVERYYGSRCFWWICLENSEWLEEQYPDCPKEENFKIDNYWAQVERYRKTGSVESTEFNTLEFIMARAKWAYKIMGKQIGASRQLLRMVRNWDFNENSMEEFNRVYEALGMYPF